MDPTDTNEISQEFGENAQGEELSHSDKMIGIFTEPTKTFEHTAKFPPRHKDWVIPMLILLILAGLVSRLAMMNEEVYFEIKQEQMKEIEKQVEEGNLTREQADQQMEGIEAFMSGPIGWITAIVGSLFVGFIVLFFLAAWYWLWSKFVLKGEGSYSSSLVANGLTAYITTIQFIITGILTLLLGTMVRDTSLASLLNSDKMTFTGFFLAKINPLSIWAFAVLSIGLAKMFKSESTGKYYALVFGSWIVVGLILFLIAQAVPFLSFLAQ